MHCIMYVCVGLPEPGNVQVGLEFVNNGIPMITVTWDVSKSKIHST